MNHEQDVLPPHSIIDDLHFCVIDLETTGGNLKTDKIIEIGMANVHQNKITATKSYYINPEKKIPEFIQKLTSITNEDVKDAPKIADVIEEIRDFIGDSIVVAHNITFDIPFLNAVLKKQKKKPLNNNILCTNVMTKYLIPGIMNSNLPYLCEVFKIPHERAHHALEDAKATAKLLIYYLKVFKERNIRKVNQLYYPKNKFELDKFHFSIKENNDWDILLQKVKNIKSPFYLSVKGEKGEILFCSVYENGEQFRCYYQQLVVLNFNCSMISIKLYGSFIEALLHLKEAFHKSADSVKQLIINHFYLRHELVKWKQKWEVELRNWPADTYSYLQQYLVKNYCIIVTRHLIDGQLMMLSAPSYNGRSALIFKLPSQKRKILQQIQALQKKDFFSIKINAHYYESQNFILLWLSVLSLIQGSEDYLIFSYQDLSLESENIEQKISKFLEKSRNKHLFPLHHL